ncbi:MAG TPA: OmpH family outer membrane protein [Vicinamibacterales bacterium]|nr:OmpH family outer membrane protein [Vicinamibacterales bacterium]
MLAGSELTCAAALAAMVGLGMPVMAQTPAGQRPAQTPAGQQPAAPKPAAKPPVAPAPAAQPKPFPVGAKYAYVDVQTVFSTSEAGKAALAKVNALREKETAAITEKNKALQALQTKLNTGGSVLSATARRDLQHQIEQGQRELQFAQQNAQAELTDLQNEVQATFQKKLMPIVEQVGTEKGLLMVFSVRDAGLLWADPGLDLTKEVTARLDRATGAGTGQ